MWNGLIIKMGSIVLKAYRNGTRPQKPSRTEEGEEWIHKFPFQISFSKSLVRIVSCVWPKFYFGGLEASHNLYVRFFIHLENALILT